MEMIQNDMFTWQLDLSTGQLDLLDNRSGRMVLGNISPGLAFWHGKTAQYLQTIGPDSQINSNETPFALGKAPFWAVKVSQENPSMGLRIDLELGLATADALAGMRIRVKNISDDAVNLGRFIFCDLAPISIEGPINAQSFYSNGWQSWSYSGVYGVNDPARRSRLGLLQKPMICNPGSSEPGVIGRFSSDFFCAFGNRIHQNGYVAGFLSQREQFGSFEVRLGENPVISCWANADEMVLLPGKQVQTDWLTFSPLKMGTPDPMSIYLDAAARENNVELNTKTLTGWCSWYHFYQNISQEKIYTNLDAMIGLRDWLPVDLVQIDDGFETQVGDWTTFRSGFPDGMKGLAQEITKQKFIPGLWLAPFIVHPGSDMAKKHPEYLLKTGSGRRARAGFVWNRLNYALDLTYPGVLDECCNLISTAVNEWGYPYLKLDFLYAAAIKCQYHDPTVTRAQVLRRGMEALRAAAGSETLLLGCGLPLGSGLGVVDAMRIGPDTASTWEPSYWGLDFVFRNEPSMPSGRNSMQNVLSRAMLHRKWWVNDPDCLLLRPETNYTLDEIRSMATAIGMTGGMFLLSDDLPALTLERLHIAEVFLPILDQRSEVLDWFDKSMPEHLRLKMENDSGEWWLGARFNWTDQTKKITLRTRDFGLEQGHYWVRSFWDGSPARIRAGDILYEGEIQPHGVVLLSIRPSDFSQPQYLGSDLHFSQGMEIHSWIVDEKQITITLQLKRKFKGVIAVYLPIEPMRVKLNGLDTAWQSFGEGRYRINVEGSETAEVVVLLKG